MAVPMGTGSTLGPHQCSPVWHQQEKVGKDSALKGLQRWFFVLFFFVTVFIFFFSAGEDLGSSFCLLSGAENNFLH